MLRPAARLVDAALLALFPVDFSLWWLAVVCGAACIVLLYWLWPGLLSIWPGVGIAVASLVVGFLLEIRVARSMHGRLR
jgi:hypothetical protein